MSHDRDSDERDEHADEREQAEAAALAAALDGREPAQAPPEDALATALLMRHGGTRGELSAERSEAILNGLLAGAPAPTVANAPTAVPAGRSAKLVRLWPLGTALAAAAALLVVWLQPWAADDPRSAPAANVTATASGAPSGLPRASVQLLSAQFAWLRAGLERERERGGLGTAQAGAGGEREVDARFERELRAYRADLFRALQAKYPAKLGALDRPPARRMR